VVSKEKIFKKSANQKQELTMAAMFVTSYEDPPEGSNGVWADLQLQYL
jgi:hypothetical protein